jgi:V/A-type H+-transporting ATPase subunit I
MDAAGIDHSPARLEAYCERGFIPIDAIEREYEELNHSFKDLKEDCSQARDRLKDCEHMKESLENILSVNVNVEQFFNLEFVKFRFGKIPKNALKTLDRWARDNEVILLPVSSDEKHCWLIYFTPDSSSDKVDGIMLSMQFERIRLSSELSGTPNDALDVINGAIARLRNRIAALTSQINSFISSKSDRLLHMYYSLIRINRNHEVRRNAMRSEHTFYICGWIPEEDLPELSRAASGNGSDMAVEEEPALVNMKPPTELKNPGIFKHFETIVKMYGLPSYGEIDPTAFVAITFTLMFGVMFGDVGQGLVIFLIGLALISRRAALGGVFACAGASSMVFGGIYGSVFGNERIIPGLLKPMEDKMTMLVAGIAIGLAFMAAATAMNVANGARDKNLARMFLDRNGVAGAVFHWTILAAGAQYALTGKTFIPVAAVVALASLAFLAIFFKEPIERLAEKKRFLQKSGNGMFFVQGFFEMVDMVLSMASNTLSFIRIGAFALSHAGLFIAFRSLSDLAGQAGGVFVTIFANVLIVALEGLGVGIQCMRLEYYELFSRFFRGDGKAYRPLQRTMM